MQVSSKQTWQQKVYHQLATVIDPELGLNIVDMGLIYEVKIVNKPNHLIEAVIEMTLTTAGCPLAGVIQAMAVEAVSQIDSQRLPRQNIRVNLVFDPPWTPAMMTQEARAKLKFLL